MEGAELMTEKEMRMFGLGILTGSVAMLVLWFALDGQRADACKSAIAGRLSHEYILAVCR
jgi:hypothetical protein